MRTTITLDEDVFEKVKSLTLTSHKPFKQVLNELLRLGLEHWEKPRTAREYVTDSHVMEVHDGLDLDNIGGLLARIEGDDYR